MLLRLLHPLHRRIAESIAHPLAAMPVERRGSVGAELPCGIEHVAEQGRPAKRLQDFQQVELRLPWPAARIDRKWHARIVSNAR